MSMKAATSDTARRDGDIVCNIRRQRQISSGGARSARRGAAWQLARRAAAGDWRRAHPRKHGMPLALAVIISSAARNSAVYRATFADMARKYRIFAVARGGSNIGGRYVIAYNIGVVAAASISAAAWRGGNNNNDGRRKLGNVF
jgi:hypothetical protein